MIANEYRTTLVIMSVYLTEADDGKERCYNSLGQQIVVECWSDVLLPVKKCRWGTRDRVSGVTEIICVWILHHKWSNCQPNHYANLESVKSRHNLNAAQAQMHCMLWMQYTISCTFGVIAPIRADVVALSVGGNQTLASREGVVHSKALVSEATVCPTNNNQNRAGPACRDKHC